MRFTLLLLFALFFSAFSQAEDVRYVSGEQRVPLRGGAGEDYPVVYKGLAAGTRITVTHTSEDGQWAEISTEDGISGWLPSQRLTLEQPAPAPAPTQTAHTPPTPTAASTAPVDTVSTLATPGAPVTTADDQATDTENLINQVDDCEAQFNTVAQELHRLKQISGKAEQLDIDNRRLVEEQENLRSEIEMLQAENQRLLDKTESEDFMNGALAVLLGVIIALVAPRLVPQRRKNSGWA